MNHLITPIIRVFCILLCTELPAQIPISSEEAVKLAFEKNPSIQLSNLQVEQQKLLKPASIHLANTELLFEAPTGNALRPGILQPLDFPTLYLHQYKAQNIRTDLAENEKDINLNLLALSVKSGYVNLQYLIEKYSLMNKLDSVLSGLIKVNELRFKVGQISTLEKVSGEAKYKALVYQLSQTKTDLFNAQRQLSLYLGVLDKEYFPNEKLTKFPELSDGDTLFYTNNNPYTSYFLTQEKLSIRNYKIEKAKFYPGILVGYLNQGTNETPTKYRLRLGVTLPIFYWSYTANIRAGKKGVDISKTQTLISSNKLNSDFIQSMTKYRQYMAGLIYYEQAGLPEANELLKSASESYRLGSISYYAYMLSIEQSFQIELSYLETIKNYNQSWLYIKYLQGQLI